MSESLTSNLDLTFRALREANIDRLPQFKNKHGGLAHSKADGSDWSPAQWLQAVVGELGEYANLRKKFERGDIDGAEFLVEAADELADVMTYLDILAFRIGVRLDVAVVDKFNRISERVGATTRLAHSSDETPAPQGWMCACGTFNYAACCQECKTMQAETNCRHIAVDEPGSTLVYHGFVSGHIGDWRCTICNTLINDGKGRGGQKTGAPQS